MKNIKYYLPAGFWLLVILVLSGYPGHKVPAAPFLQFDKLVHTFIYAVLSILLLIAYSKQYQNKHNRYSLVMKIVFFGIFYGGFMEILQHYIFINRSGNWYDFGANTLGAILGALIYPYVIKLLPINKWIK
jgi:VanZ family protein